MPLLMPAPRHTHLGSSQLILCLLQQPLKAGHCLAGLVKVSLLRGREAHRARVTARPTQVLAHLHISWLSILRSNQS
jgi:hypothetical protein